jgi:hypothetical protein
VIIEAYCYYQLHTKFYSVLFSRLRPYIAEIIGDQCGFQCNRLTTNQIFLHSSDTGEKLDCNKAIHQLFLDCKKACDSVRNEVLYSILIEFEVPMKVAHLIKVCL